MAKFLDVKLTVDTKSLKDKIGKTVNDINQLPKRALVKFKQETPIKSGNAVRKTTLTQSTTGKSQIHANYPYAQRLDDGYSKKAPEGMTEPTEQWLAEEFKKIAKRHWRR